MIYNNTCEGFFISRPNRFIAHVEIDSKTEIAHVKNTGRCRELLISGARVILQRSDNPLRKTQYDLIAVCKGRRLINMDSQAPNKVETVARAKFRRGSGWAAPCFKFFSAMLAILLCFWHFPHSFHGNYTRKEREGGFVVLFDAYRL